MLQLVPLLLPGIMEILKRVIPDPKEQAQAQADIERLLAEQQSEVLKASRDVIVAEAQSESALARNWRPVLMYLLMFLIVWLAVVAPIFGFVDASLKALAGVPDNLWILLTIGMGGYMGLRSLEKIADTLKGGGGVGRG